MSYLTQYALQRPGAPQRARRGARLDERAALNLPEFDGGAHVRVFVEDTSRKRRWRRTPPRPKLRLRIGDCTNVIHLDFGVECADRRENSLYKIDTLLASLHRFRDAFAAEAALYEERERRN